jgi:hypothetical protein
VLQRASLAADCAPHTRMFRDRDLPVRALATLLPGVAATRLTERATPLLGGSRLRHAAEVAGDAAARLLGDPAAGDAVRRRWLAALALDDLDACRAWARVGAAPGAAAVEGEDLLPPPGGAVFAGFHLSGGLAVFEVLRRRGFSPTFLRAPSPAELPRYDRAIATARLGYLARVLDPPWILTGQGVREALDRHLGAGGSVVALIDVPVDAVQLRDRAPATLFGRAVRLPVGLLRLAHAHGLPVVPFDGRVDDGRRVVRFHRPARGADVAELLGDVVPALERAVRERPWNWHSWLEIEQLFAAEAGVAAGASEAVLQHDPPATADG